MFEQGHLCLQKGKGKKIKMSPHLHGPLKPSSERALGVPLAFFAIWSRFVSLRCPPDPRVPEVGVILLDHLVPFPGWHQLPLSNRNRMEQSYELPAAAAIDASGKHLDPSIHRSLPLRCCSTRSSDTQIDPAGRPSSILRAPFLRWSHGGRAVASPKPHAGYRSCAWRA